MASIVERIMDSTSAFAPQAPSVPHIQPAHGPASTQPLSAIAAGERCPSCSALVASDQRYCLECGQRRGDPRLPFMDAVVFMSASAQRRREAAAVPQVRHRSRLSPSATLVGGIGTLLLAMGIGVLIGHGGNSGSSGVAGKPSVQVIKVPAVGATTSTSTPGVTTGKPAKVKTSSHGGGSAKKPSAAAAVASGSGGGASSVLHPTQPLPPSTVHVGGTCHGAAAGCSNGKFTGNFFGE